MSCIEFYAKIIFRSVQQADYQLHKLKTFFKEGVYATDFWRACPDDADAPKFWTDFNTRFPIVSEYLSHAGLFGRCLTELSSFMSFGEIDQIDARMFRKGKSIYFSGEFWDMTDWQHLDSFIWVKFGGNMFWINEYCINAFDTLDRHSREWVKKNSVKKG